MTALPIFGGSNQRRSAAVWLDELAKARVSTEPVDTGEPQDGPPPPMRWAKRRPEAAVRLEAARAAISGLSERVGVPTENLVSPEVVRRLCWDWTKSPDAAAAIDTVMREGGARTWQRELVVPALVPTLTESG